MKKILLFICALLVQFQCIGAVNQIENPYIIKIRSTTSFDLPKNTPGYQGLQTKKMKYGYKDCLHVIVPGTEYNMYFPIDGTQPTSPEVGECLCANLDNREDSPITNWYMTMFGLTPLSGTNEYLLSGWRDQKECKIINLDASMDDTIVVDSDAKNYEKKEISRKEFFLRKFRQIATNPIGRCLLYRLLIEIRRHYGDPANGVCEDNMNININEINSSCLNKYRNLCRNLNIHWHPQKFDFAIRSPEGIWGIVNVNDTKLKKQMAIKQTHDRKFAVIGIEESKICDDLFHELVHWFHFLRDPYRFYGEGIVVDKDNKEMMRIYYEWVISTEQKRIALKPWFVKNGTTNTKCASFEELRTILGMPKDSQKYLEGDDISENAFLLSFFNGIDPLIIRFGHKNKSFTENIESILVAQEVACNSVENYTKTAVGRTQLPMENRFSCIVRNIRGIAKRKNAHHAA